MKDIFRQLQGIVQRLRVHQGFRRQLGNTSWMFADQAFRMISGLLVGIWVARFLGPEHFGVYAYAVMFVALFSPLAKLGLDDLVVRGLMQPEQSQAAFMGTAFWTKLSAALVTMLLTITAAFALSGAGDQSAYVAIVAAGLLFQSFEVIDFYFQSQVLAKYVSSCRMLQILLSSVVKVYLILIQAELLWFVLVLLLDQVTLAATLLWAYRIKTQQSFFKHCQLDVAKKLLVDGFPLMFNALMIMLYMRMDQFMISSLLGARELGLYAAATRLSEAVYVIPVVIASSVFPILVRAQQTSEALYISRLKYVYTVMLWSAVFIASFTTLFSNVIIDLTYGKNYQEAAHFLAIHIWTVVFVFIGVPFSKHLVIQNQGSKLLRRTVIGMLLNLTLLYVFLPLYGVQAAAFSALMCQGFVNFFGDFFDASQHEQMRIKVSAFFKPFTPYLKA